MYKVFRRKAYHIGTDRLDGGLANGNVGVEQAIYDTGIHNAPPSEWTAHLVVCVFAEVLHRRTVAILPSGHRLA
jgi:hypothetical protein